VFNKAAATLFYYYDVLTQRLYNVVLTVSRLERYVKEKKIRNSKSIIFLYLCI